MKGPDPATSPPFHEALSDAIAARSTSLARLQRKLHDRGTSVSLATLSYWRSGHRHPEGAASRDVVSELEDLLDLSPRSLTDLIGRAERSRIGPSPVIVESDGYDHRELNEAIDAVGRDLLEAVREVSCQVTVDVDATGAQHRTSLRALVQAQVDGATHFPYVVTSPEELAADPDFQALHGCRVERRYTHPNRRVFAAVYSLEHVLALGETSMVEIAITLPAGGSEDTEYQHVLTRPEREVMLWVRFDPDLVPRWFEGFTVIDGHDVATRHPVSGTAIHVARQSVGPGIVGLRWEF